MNLIRQFKRQWALKMAFRRHEKASSVMPDMEYLISDANMILRYVEMGETPDTDIVNAVSENVKTGGDWIDSDDGGIGEPKAP